MDAVVRIRQRVIGNRGVYRRIAVIVDVVVAKDETAALVDVDMVVGLIVEGEGQRQCRGEIGGLAAPTDIVPFTPRGVHPVKVNAGTADVAVPDIVRHAGVSSQLRGVGKGRQTLRSHLERG